MTLAFTDELPKFLYHGTRGCYLPEILNDGLAPRSVSANSQWRHSVESRSDAVYLTTAYPLHFAVNAQGTGGIVILEIAAQTLNPCNLVADEDALAHSLNLPQLAGLALQERTRYFREHSHMYSPLESLRILGTCAHLGVVPRTAVTRIARVSIEDMGSLVVGGFDPQISPMNYRYFGADYEQGVAWLFGDAEICRLNPNMHRPSIQVELVHQLTEPY